LFLKYTEQLTVGFQAGTCNAVSVAGSPFGWIENSRTY